jgi:hypothetical protein
VIPQGGELLTIKNQSYDIVSWFKVNINQTQKQVITFVVVPTGIEADLEFTSYVTTVQMYGLVYHIFTKITSHDDYVKAMANHPD